MTQIVLNIEKPSLVRLIKSLVANISGVHIVSENPKVKNMSKFERAMQDVKEGRVEDFNSVEDLLANVKGEI